MSAKPNHDLKSQFIDQNVTIPSTEKVDNPCNPMEVSQKRASRSIIHQLFGCCLDRSLISRSNTNTDIKDNSQDDTETYTKNNQPPHLKFNENQTKIPSQMGPPSMMNQQDLLRRSSSVQSKTHNYDFDISNFNTDTMFLYGKSLMLIIMIRDQNHRVNYQCQVKDDIKQLRSLNENNTKFYKRRHIYFSGHENEVELDKYSWIHLVPECIVNHIAKKAASSSRKESIIDATCGFGQFPIAFSRFIESVIAIEPDEDRFECARKNALAYQLRSRSYSQSNRLDASEGILFYTESSFIDGQFNVKANRSDCIFIASHLTPKYLDCISLGANMNTYFESDEFYFELKSLLKKAFTLAPQVILLTPRNIKIAEVCDAFTEAIKDNISKVKRCSLSIEKHLVNNHLKFVCFYFGDFNRNELSGQEEFRYINNELQKCDKLIAPKGKFQSSPSMSPPSQKQSQLRIHQQIFSELGKFQVLNIVIKFIACFKMKKVIIPNISNFESLNQALLSIFYEYLVEHNLISLKKISQISHMKQSMTSSMTPSSNHEKQNKNKMNTISPQNQIDFQKEDQEKQHHILTRSASVITTPSRNISQLCMTDEGLAHSNSLRTQDANEFKRDTDRTLTTLSDKSGSWTGHSIKPNQLRIMPEHRTTTINFSDIRATREFVEDRSKTVEGSQIILAQRNQDEMNSDDFYYRSCSGSATESGSEQESQISSVTSNQKSYPQIEYDREKEDGGKEGEEDGEERKQEGHLESYDIEDELGSNQLDDSQQGVQQKTLQQDPSINSNANGIVRIQRVVSDLNWKQQKEAKQKTVPKIPINKFNKSSSFQSQNSATASRTTTKEQKITFNFNFFQLNINDQSLNSSLILL